MSNNPDLKIEIIDTQQKKGNIEMGDVNEQQPNAPDIQIQSSGTFPLSVLELEKLMGNYKERGSNYLDLQAIHDLGGPDAILQKLKTSIDHGIHSIDNRENDFGSNKVFVEPVPHFCAYVWEALEDLMIRILIVAAIVQIVLGATLSDHPDKDWVDGLSIIVAVLVVVCVGSVTNWKKETKFHELNDIQNAGTTYKAIRDGKPIDLVSDDILVGDILHIMVGDIIPADLMLLEGNGIKLDESALTGESDTMKKEPYIKCCEIREANNKPPSPLILSGTNLIEGTGVAVVLAVGDHSQKGIIKRTVDNAQENNQTPLEQKLNVIAENIGWFGMGAGIVTLVALFIRFGINYAQDLSEYHTSEQVKKIIEDYVQYNLTAKELPSVSSELNATFTHPKSNISNQVLNIILLCVSIIVVAIPEGLPLAVTLSLAFSIKKLMDQNNLVRKMHACETMGGANYICTDKTGTLTKNEMNVFKVLMSGKEITLKETIDDIQAGTLSKKASTTTNKKMREDSIVYFPNHEYWEYLKTGIALNIDGTIRK